MLDTEKIAPISPDIVGDHQEPISPTRISTGQYRSTDFLLGLTAWKNALSTSKIPPVSNFFSLKFN